MKQFFAAALVVLILCGTVLPVLAVTVETDGSAATEIPVNGVFREQVDTQTIISVDITWDSMDFTYSSAVKQTWDPNQHIYTSSTTGGWSGEARKITLTNHSNAAVSAALSFTPSITGVNGTFEKTQLYLDSAVDTSVNNAPFETTAFSITSGEITGNSMLGTIRTSLSSDSSPDTGGDEPTSGNDVPAATENAVCYYTTVAGVSEQTVAMTQTGDGLYTAIITDTVGASELYVRFVVDGTGYAISGTSLQKLMSYKDVVPVTSGEHVTITIDIKNKTCAID